MMNQPEITTMDAELITLPDIEGASPVEIDTRSRKRQLEPVIPGLSWEFCIVFRAVVMGIVVGAWFGTIRCFAIEADAIVAHRRLAYFSPVLESFFSMNGVVQGSKIVDAVTVIGVISGVMIWVLKEYLSQSFRNGKKNTCIPGSALEESFVQAGTAQTGYFKISMRVLFAFLAISILFSGVLYCAILQGLLVALLEGYFSRNIRGLLLTYVATSTLSIVFLGDTLTCFSQLRTLAEGISDQVQDGELCALCTQEIRPGQSRIIPTTGVKSCEKHACHLGCFIFDCITDRCPGCPASMKVSMLDVEDCSFAWVFFASVALWSRISYYAKCTYSKVKSLQS